MLTFCLLKCTVVLVEGTGESRGKALRFRGYKQVSTVWGGLLTLGGAAGKAGEWVVSFLYFGNEPAATAAAPSH